MDSIGMGGRFAPESVDELDRNMHSRVSGKHGVCYGGPGPGMTNMISGMMEAYATCTPLIILSATASTQTRGLPAFQEADQLEMARAVTKWAVRVDSPPRIPWAIRRAFAVSMNGKPGPVYLKYPQISALPRLQCPTMLELNTRLGALEIQNE